MHDERVNCEIVYGTGLSFIPDIFNYVQYLWSFAKHYRSNGRFIAVALLV